VALVGNRGMITQTRIDEDIAPAGLDWITALRAPLSLFDRRDMAAITSPDYPGERLIVCRNCELAEASRPVGCRSRCHRRCRRARQAAAARQRLDWPEGRRVQRCVADLI
jgi:hypothetical protein